MIFLIWLFINKNKSWNLNIFIPQAVDPAQPPMNIKKRKKISGNLPHKLKSLVTYPVPDKMDTTLKEAILIFSTIKSLLLLNSKYKNIIKVEKIKR